MKKETLMEIILGTIGGLIFALGMCMCLIVEWNLLKAGVVISIIGAIILLAIIPIHRKANPRNRKPINFKNVAFVVLGIIGALVMGYGMTRIMTGTPTTTDYIVGIVIGIIGLAVCILNFPIYKYIEDK